jgi:hypothetical protein
VHRPPILSSPALSRARRFRLIQRGFGSRYGVGRWIRGFDGAKAEFLRERRDDCRLWWPGWRVLFRW